MESRIEPAASEEPSLLEHIRRGPLVGRRRELTEALADLRHALDGEGRVLLISGEPGVGKTRFAREIMAQMRASGGTALLGECYAEGDVPYAPIARMIRETFPQAASLELPESVMADLTALAAGLRSYPPAIPANPAVDPRAEQLRLFESVAAWCEALSARSPLLLFVDDVHWADSGTLFLLRHLARRGRSLCLLIVMTLSESESRPSADFNSVLLDLNRERLAAHLKLGRLGRDGTRDLLAAMFNEEITPEFLEGIYRQTEGNPFFVEEVCKAFIEDGKLSYAGGRWQRSSMADIKIPQTVRAAIEARVARVPEAAQQALRLAAIIGREFDFETLRRAGDLDEETLIGALESAVRAQLIAEVGGTAPLRFSFVHALIPTSLREGTLHLRRRLLHERVARALEALRPDDFEALAYHYAEAGAAERARGYFRLAGDRARSWAPQDAARLYRAALELRTAADDPDRAATLARLGYCLWLTADAQGALACYEEAFRLFEATGDRVQAGDTQRMIGQIHYEQGDPLAARRHDHRALEILEQGPETVELARAINTISFVHMLTPEPDEAIAFGERALAMAERLGADDVVVQAMIQIGSAYGGNGDYEKALPLLELGIQKAMALELPGEVYRACNNLAFALQTRCHYAEAIAWLEQAHVHAARTYEQHCLMAVAANLLTIRWLTGQWRSALAYRQQIKELGSDLYTTWVRRTLASIDLDLGRFEEGRRELEETLPGALRADDLATTVTHLGQMVRVYAATEQQGAAARAVASMLGGLARRPYPFCEVIMPLFFACQWLAGQSATTASEQGRDCLSHLQRLDDALNTEESRAALMEARACLLMPEGCQREAAEHFREAAAGWARIDRPYDRARALRSLGRALDRSGDAAGARLARGEAFQIVESLAAQLDDEWRASFMASPLVQNLREAVQTGSRQNGAGKGEQAWASLTERELDVLRLVARGLTNPQIAEQLVVSPRTVNAHLRSIFGKLDVTRRTAAARLAVERGLT